MACRLPGFDKTVAVSCCLFFATAFINIYLKNSFKISSGSVDIDLRDRQNMKEEVRAKRHYWGIHLNWEMSKITSKNPKLCTWETKDKEFEELGT